MIYCYDLSNLPMFMNCINFCRGETCFCPCVSVYVCYQEKNNFANGWIDSCKTKKWIIVYVYNWITSGPETKWLSQLSNLGKYKIYTAILHYAEYKFDVVVAESHNYLRLWAITDQPFVFVFFVFFFLFNELWLLLLELALFLMNIYDRIWGNLIFHYFYFNHFFVRY